MNNRVFTIFIGSSSEAKPYAETLASLIQEQALFEVIPWWDMTQAGDSFLESLFRMTRRTTFAILVATADDLLVKRNKTSLAIRDNVLFEYGLFAGHLGRHSAILVQIGNTDVPSDLRGIQLISVKPSDDRTPERLRDCLRGTATRCINDLLCPRLEEFELALLELRDRSFYLQPDSLRPLLARAMSHSIDASSAARLSNANMKSLLEKYKSPNPREVGREKHITELHDFIDLSSIFPDDLSKLSATFAQFASRYLLQPNASELCATRIALHYKADLTLLAAVVAQMQIHPALVDLDASSHPIKGRYFRGEHAIFLHDFTTTGFTPLSCIAELRKHGVLVKRIISFFVREDTLDELEQHCAKQGVEFRVFCVARGSGDLEIRKDAV
jgi:hypothetical protein